MIMTSRATKSKKSKALLNVAKNIAETPNLPEYQSAALLNPFVHFAFVAGVASGKTFIGVHWVLLMIWSNPGKTGFVGANTHDQLSTATLQELFLWFNEYGIEYVSDKMPPKEWKAPKRYKKYDNVISLRYTINGKEYISYIHTRVMSGANNLRGITITWAWMDELAFAPESAHNVVLSRLRETKGYFRTLATTTTNGENWFYKRYVINKSKIYRTMHVPTLLSVEAGIISPEFYESLLSSYSENLAQQELFAKYVNILAGRAYYAATKDNEKHLCPWSGSAYPDPEYPLEIGCDFNYSPAPMVWTISQKSPDGTKIHTFKEISATECSSEDMAHTLVSAYGDFYLRIYGDASGVRGTTSNKGKTDFDYIGQVLGESGCMYNIDADQMNPRVVARVENQNRLLRNGAGEVTHTYNPDACPLFHGDMRKVGWNQQGKLTGNSDVLLTHASDATGYMLMKVFPPLSKAAAITTQVSKQRLDINSAL